MTSFYTSFFISLGGYLLGSLAGSKYPGTSAANKIVQKLKANPELASKTLAYMQRLEEGLADEDDYTVPGIKALADMVTTGETREDYEKRRRTVNTLPSGNTRNILPSYDPVIISKVTKVQ